MRKKAGSISIFISLISIIMFTNCSVFAAVILPSPDPLTYQLTYPTSSPSGRTWYVSVWDEINNCPFFSTAEVNIATVETWYQTVAGGDWIKIPWRDIRLGSHQGTQITINFDPQVVPDSAYRIAVFGELYNGETFLSIGPGFMWRKAGG